MKISLPTGRKIEDGPNQHSYKYNLLWLLELNGGGWANFNLESQHSTWHL